MDRHLGHIAVGIVRRHGKRKRLHETLGLIPSGALDRRHHVQALAARELDETFKLEGGEPLAYLAGSLHGLLPLHA